MSSTTATAAWLLVPKASARQQAWYSSSADGSTTTPTLSQRKGNLVYTQSLQRSDHYRCVSLSSRGFWSRPGCPSLDKMAIQTLITSCSSRYWGFSQSSETYVSSHSPQRLRYSLRRVTEVRRQPFADIVVSISHRDDDLASSDRSLDSIGAVTLAVIKRGDRGCLCETSVGTSLQRVQVIMF